MRKIQEKIKEKHGWLHIGTMPIITIATFRGGLDIPIDLAILDNRIKCRQEATLGLSRRSPKYKKIIF
jgi:hypothetical protein